MTKKIEKIYWSITEKQYELLFERIVESKKIRKAHFKVILFTLLIDITKYWMINSKCPPEYTKDRKIIYNYDELVRPCGLRTIRTLKKYLHLLEDLKIIELLKIPDKNRISIKVNWHNL